MAGARACTEVPPLAGELSRSDLGGPNSAGAAIDRNEQRKVKRRRKSQGSGGACVRQCDRRDSEQQDCWLTGWQSYQEQFFGMKRICSGRIFREIVCPRVCDMVFLRALHRLVISPVLSTTGWPQTQGRLASPFLPNICRPARSQDTRKMW